MKRYILASLTARESTDLREYEKTIEEAVHKVIPEAKVRVEKDCYFVSPTPPQGKAVRIGRLICQSKLKEHCIHVPKLFYSVEVEENVDGE